MVNCNKCGVELTDNNWTKSWKDKGLLRCKKCSAESNSRSNPRNNPRRMFVNGKYISQKHPLYKPGKYKSFNDAAFSSLVNYVLSTEGEVYILKNPAWKNWYKIGRAVDAEDRCYVYQTSSPYRDYAVVASIEVAHGVMGEKIAHSLAEGLCKKNNKEWFYIEHLEKRGFQKFLELVKTIIEERVDGRISTNT